MESIIPSWKISWNLPSKIFFDVKSAENLMKIKKRKDGIDRSILKDFMKSSIKYSSIDVKSMKKFNENQKKKKEK